MAHKTGGDQQEQIEIQFQNDLVLKNNGGEKSYFRQYHSQT